MTFSDVVEGVKNLSTDEKREIQRLLQQYLLEESRDEIYKNFKSAQTEAQAEELIFSADIEELKRQMAE